MPNAHTYLVWAAGTQRARLRAEYEYPVAPIDELDDEEEDDEEDEFREPLDAVAGVRTLLPGSLS